MTARWQRRRIAAQVIGEHFISQNLVIRNHFGREMMSKIDTRVTQLLEKVTRLLTRPAEMFRENGIQTAAGHRNS